MREGNNLVGVDIGSSAIKVCQVRESRRSLQLLNFACVPLPPQAIVDGQVMDGNTVVEVLQQLWRSARISGREVSLGVSTQAAIVRKITVPMMTAEELAEQIQWEAEQHIPFDIKDVYVDYQVLRRNPDASQMDLLLVAAKREQINDYAQLARDARLKPIVCDIDSFSIQNLFEQARGLPEDKTIALVNVGAALTSLNIVTNGVSAFTREIASGGNLVTEQIQKRLGVPFEQAEGLKCCEPAEMPPELLPVLDSTTDSIAAEIQRSLDFFMATSADGELAHIYLMGGSSKLPPLAQAIERRSRVPVETWSPAEKLNVDAKRVPPEQLSRFAPQLAVALGLSLRKSKEVRA
jgi:type IV pilus assembly protein PilM